MAPDPELEPSQRTLLPVKSGMSLKDLTDVHEEPTAVFMFMIARVRTEFAHVRVEASRAQGPLAALPEALEKARTDPRTKWEAEQVEHSLFQVLGSVVK